MNINGIHGSRGVTGTTAFDPKPAHGHSSIPPAPDAAATRTHISGPGQLFSRLQRLAAQDPEKFKEVAQEIADQLTTAAQSSDGRASDLAQKLADRFAQAAESGDLSAFQPRRDHGSFGHHHHHHHHHHGPFGGGEAVRSVLENALDLVHEALTAPSADASPSAAPLPGFGTAAPSTDAAAPSTDAAAPSTDAAAPSTDAAAPSAEAPATNSDVAV